MKRENAINNKEKIVKTIKIKEEVRIPGTDIILEAGDRIEVLHEGRVVTAEFDLAIDQRELMESISMYERQYSINAVNIVPRGPGGWPVVTFSGNEEDLQRFSQEVMDESLEVFLV